MSWGWGRSGWAGHLTCWGVALRRRPRGWPVALLRVQPVECSVAACGGGSARRCRCCCLHCLATFCPCPGCPCRACPPGPPKHNADLSPPIPPLQGPHILHRPHASDLHPATCYVAESSLASWAGAHALPAHHRSMQRHCGTVACGQCPQHCCAGQPVWPVLRVGAAIAGLASDGSIGALLPSSPPHLCTQSSATHTCIWHLLYCSSHRPAGSSSVALL